jgi:hexulose-6-phosphate isomerase
VFPAINAWTFPSGTTPAAQIAGAAAAGFAGIELVVEEDGPLRPETSPDVFADLGRQAADAGLRVAGVATALFWQFSYGSPEATDRERARDLTLRMLDQAAAADAGAILVVPAVVGLAQEPRMRVSYLDALQRTHDALLSLRHEAEDRRVVLAVENVWNRFLLSPVELADLIDRVNSPFVGVYLDVGNILAAGYPEDWVATLGRRVKRVHMKDYDLSKPGEAGFCPLGEGSVNWPAVLSALRAAGYDGPLTYEGSGDVGDAYRRLAALLAPGPTEDLT